MIPIILNNTVQVVVLNNHNAGATGICQFELIGAV